jgi:hypothetical protein
MHCIELHVVKCAYVISLFGLQDIEPGDVCLLM